MRLRLDILRLSALVGVLLLTAASGSGQTGEPRWLVDAPTAGVLERERQVLDIRGTSDNGALVELEFGIWHRVLVSASFGGQHLVGGNSTNWNPDPGVSIRIRILNESDSRPAFALGFRSQGSGNYDDTLNRYRLKSLGVYGVFSRNYRHTMGQGGLHFGLNRSLEDGDGDDTLTGFAGADVEFAERVTLLGEYHFAFNDDGGVAPSRGRGYLNVGLRVYATRQVAIEFDVKDLLENGGAGVGTIKELRLILMR